MKNAITCLAAVVSLGMLASSSIACSSSEEKEEVDTGSALSQLRSPTGSFSEASAGKAFGGYRSDRASSSKVAAPSSIGSAGQSGTQSIRLLDRASSAQSGCGANQACACPNGGSMTYQAASSPEGQLVKVTFDECGFEDGWGFDGKAILLASNKSLLGLDKESAAPPPAKKPATDFGSDTGSGSGLHEAEDTGYGGGAVAFLIAAKGTATDGQRKLALSFALLRESPYTFLAVAVPDGKIVIGVSDDGRAIVRSKEGTWRCQSGARAWSCTSDKGQKMEIAEEASGAVGALPSSDSP